MMARIHDCASAAYAWMKRHKIISILLILSAVIMVFGRFASTEVGSTPDEGNVDKGALRSTIYGFVQEYGTWSWQDPFNTETLEDYAHADLATDVAEQRISDYVSAAEAKDPEGAKSLAAQRMQQTGAVKVSSIESIDVLENTGEAFEIEIQASEYSFSNEGGLVKQECVYSIDIERTKGAGITSPYQVVRFIKN